MNIYDILVFTMIEETYLLLSMTTTESIHPFNEYK